MRIATMDASQSDDLPKERNGIAAGGLPRHDSMRIAHPADHREYSLSAIESAEIERVGEGTCCLAVLDSDGNKVWLHIHGLTPGKLQDAAILTRARAQNQ